MLEIIVVAHFGVAIYVAVSYMLVRHMEMDQVCGVKATVVYLTHPVVVAMLLALIVAKPESGLTIALLLALLLSWDWSEFVATRPVLYGCLCLYWTGVLSVLYLCMSSMQSFAFKSS